MIKKHFLLQNALGQKTCADYIKYNQFHFVTGEEFYSPAPVWNLLHSRKLFLPLSGKYLIKNFKISEVKKHTGKSYRNSSTMEMNSRPVLKNRVKNLMFVVKIPGGTNVSLIQIHY